LPPEAEAVLVFGLSVETVDLPAFLKLGNAKKSDICLIFAKRIMGGNKTGGAGDKLGGPALPQPGPKTATDCIVLNHA